MKAFKLMNLTKLNSSIKISNNLRVSFQNTFFRNYSDLLSVFLPNKGIFDLILEFFINKITKMSFKGIFTNCLKFRSF